MQKLTKNLILRELLMLLNPNRILLILLFFVVITPLLAQQEVKTYTILGIDVQGNKYADKGTIIALSALREGDQLSFPGDGQNKVQLAIKNLWQRKQFSEVDIIIEKTTPMGIFLLIKVKEFPHLKKINIANNHEVSDEEIKK